MSQNRNSAGWARLKRQPGFYALKPGTWVTVKHCANSYPLPSGLEPGLRVKVVRFDAGFYTVESKGQKFKVFMQNIDKGPG
jgi:hypothetical protein